MLYFEFLENDYKLIKLLKNMTQNFCDESFTFFL